MRVDTSRRYYFPIYLICIIFFVLFPNLISFIFLFFVVLSIEIHKATHYLEIRKNKEIYIFEGIFNKKVTKIKKELINSITLEKNPYLQLLNLSNLVIRTFDREFKIVGIKEGEKIFKLLSKE